MANPRKSGCCCGPAAPSDAERTEQALTPAGGGEVKDPDTQGGPTDARPAGTEEANYLRFHQTRSA